MKLAISLVVTALCLLSAGCDQNDKLGRDIPVSYAPAEDATPKSNSKVGPFQKEFDGISFSVPKGWQEVEVTPQQQGFVDARFLIPSKDTDIQLTCSSIGGGIDANFERWVGQFEMAANEKPQTDSLKVDTADAKSVELHGTYNSGMMSRERPREDWRMIGIAIPMGEHDFYLKLLGPSDAVALVRDDFRAFAKSGRFKK